MRLKLLCALLIPAFVLHLTGYGRDGEVLSYEKPVTLIGTLVEERYPEDSPLAYRTHSAWVLRLSKPISLDAASDRKDEIDVKEANVTEIQLWGDRSKYAADRGLLIGKRVQATGTLRHQIRTVELRSILMDVSDLEPLGETPRE